MTLFIILGIIFFLSAAAYGLGWIMGHASAQRERWYVLDGEPRRHSAHVIEPSGGETVRVIPPFDQDASC